jgi:PmbA protein
MISTDLLSDIVQRAIKHGATDAEAIGSETTKFSVKVRLGEVEQLEEAASRGLGLRVLYHGRQASCSTSDVSAQGVGELIATAVEMVKSTSVDESALLPAKDELATDIPDLELYDGAVAALPTERKIELARRCEEAARGFDPRITNSDGCSFATSEGRFMLTSSAGFAGEYRMTTCRLSVTPIAKDGDQMQVGYWGDGKRQFEALDDAEAIGREAARRALRKLGARRVATQEAPIVFEASVAEELLSNLLEAVTGDAVFRRASFLMGKLGEPIAAPALTIIDDGATPGAIGSRPFDDEGLPTRRTAVIENGVLTSYLLNSYTARKLGLRSTGNADRALVGAPRVGPGNFFLSPGVHTREELIASVNSGFYVTDLFGFGYNAVTGDYSRGAAGWWIENGELAFPVEEVTIAGNLREMLLGIEMIGNDLKFRGRIASPTIKVRKMVVSGA